MNARKQKKKINNITNGILIWIICKPHKPDRQIGEIQINDKSIFR